MASIAPEEPSLSPKDMTEMGQTLNAATTNLSSSPSPPQTSAAPAVAPTTYTTCLVSFNHHGYEPAIEIVQSPKFVEEVGDTRKHAATDPTCPSILSCDAGEEDEGGMTEHSAALPSDQTEDNEFSMNEVSCSFVSFLDGFLFV